VSYDLQDLFPDTNFNAAKDLQSIDFDFAEFLDNSHLPTTTGEHDVFAAQSDSLVLNEGEFDFSSTITADLTANSGPVPAGADVTKIHGYGFETVHAAGEHGLLAAGSSMDSSTATTTAWDGLNNVPLQHDFYSAATTIASLQEWTALFSTTLDTTPTSFDNNNNNDNDNDNNPPLPSTTLTPPPSQNTSPVLGLLLEPSKDNVSPSASPDGPDTKKRKRERNTEAARRYRQRRQDRLEELEEALAAMTGERDGLRLRLARAEAEADVLRGLMGKKG